MYLDSMGWAVQDQLMPVSSFLTSRDRVAVYNSRFSKYPKLVYDKNWIYGTWYLGTSFKKAEYYGQYPPHFLDRLMALFPDAEAVLHLCSGTVNSEGVTLDLDTMGKLKPHVRGDAQILPFRSNSFDLIDIDPPYSQRDAEYYNTPYLSIQKVMNEALRILKPRGHLCILDVRYPSYSRKKGWRLIGLITVVTGFARVTRILSIFQKRG